MQKITPFLWFNDNAEEAVNFYISIFKDAKILSVSRYGEAEANAAGRPQGSVMTVAFQLAGQTFTALNGGPHFKFTEAISFVINCETQQAIDEYWERLSEGGKTLQCGWLKDKYGVAWQVVPSFLGEIIQDSDPKRSERVMSALLQMDKLDIEKLRAACDSG
jgi:predicted 3-demethylubiquinone-9 3-methyltransferase (glyoxalase superfamily)